MFWGQRDVIAARLGQEESGHSVPMVGAERGDG